jgi:hypothetical protein
MSFPRIFSAGVLPYIIFCSIFSIQISTFAHAESVTISVRETQLRSDRDFLSRGSKLSYGDMLSVLSKDESWLKVRTLQGKEGFVHRSAITDRVIKINAGRKTGLSDNYSSKDEVVLASKGFDKDVEKQFAQNNRSLNFSAVNQMEQLSVSGNEVSSFIKSGMLLQAKNGGE